MDLELDPDFLKFLSLDPEYNSVSESIDDYISKKNSSFKNTEKNHMDIDFKDGGLANLPKSDLFEDNSEYKHKTFYMRDAKRLGIEIEDYITDKMLPIYKSYIINDLYNLQKYVNYYLNKKPDDYESFIYTITELYKRVEHQFNEYYELNKTYKLYNYKKEYKRIVYDYDKSIMTYKAQFDNYKVIIKYLLLI